MKTIVWIAALALVTGCAANASEDANAGAGANQPAGDNTGDPNGTNGGDDGSGEGTDGSGGSSTPTPTSPGLGGVDTSQEQACPMTDIPPAGDSQYTDGNPTCFDLYGAEYPNVQQMKITTFTDGLYQMPDGFDVTLHFSSNHTFDYNCADANLVGVFVKAGPGGNVYKGAYGASGLQTPNGYGFSHVDFCYVPWAPNQVP